MPGGRVMATALQNRRRERLMAALEAAPRGLTTRQLADRCGMSTAEARRQLHALSQQRMRLKSTYVQHGGRCTLHWQLLGAA